MFIALTTQNVCAPSERNVSCVFSLHAAPDGAGSMSVVRDYKHIAPPEQDIKGDA